MMGLNNVSRASKMYISNFNEYWLRTHSSGDNLAQQLFTRLTLSAHTAYIYLLRFRFIPFASPLLLITPIPTFPNLRSRPSSLPLSYPFLLTTYRTSDV